MSNLGKGKHGMHEARDSNPIFIASRIVKGFLSGRQEDTAYSDTNFKAFISYKHSVSTNFALRLEQALKIYAKPLLARPIRIFRDEKHFAPGIDLPKLIVNALNVSEFLILLASPEAANSGWVCDELVHWCAGLKQTKNLIIVLVEGEIAVDNDTKQIDWARTNALPAMLKPYLLQVPLYLDMRGVTQFDDLTLSNPDFKKAVNGITARFRGIDPNEMLGEEVLQHRRNLRLRNGAVVTLVAMTLASMITAYVAVIQRKEAIQQTRIALSRQYAAEAVNLMENNLDEAIFRAVDAVKTEHTFEGRSLLFQTLFYNTNIEAFLYQIREKGSEPPAYLFDPYGNKIVFVVNDTLQLFDLNEKVTSSNQNIRLSVGNISSIAYSHSGSTLAIGLEDGRVSLVNTSQWKMIASPLKISQQPVSRLFFSAADDRLFAISDGQIFRCSIDNFGLTLSETVQIQEPKEDLVIRDYTGAPTGRYLRDITTNTTDGRFFVAATREKFTDSTGSLVTGARRQVILWDMLGSTRQRYSFSVHEKYTVGIREVAISPDGTKLVVDLVAGSDGINLNFLQIFSIGGVGTADELITINGPITFTTEKYLPNRSRLSFSSSGDRLLIGDRESTFRMIDFKKLAEYKQDINYKEGNKSEAVYRERLNKAIKSIKLKGLSGIIYEPRFASDENRVLLRIGSRIVLWNPGPKPMLSHTLLTHNHSPVGLRYSRNGDELVFARDDGGIYISNLFGAKPEISTQSFPSSSNALLSEDGSQIAVVKDDHITFYNSRAGNPLRNFSLNGWRVLAFSPDGALLAQFRQGILRVLSTSDFREAWKTELYDKREIENPPVREPGVTFSADSSSLVVHVFGATKLTLWDAHSGRPLNVFDTGIKRSWDRPPVVSPDDKWIATAGNNYSLAIVNTLTREVTKVEARGSICGVVFSPDNANLAISYESEKESVSDSMDGRYHPADYGVVFWEIAAKRWEALNIKTSSPPCHTTFNRTGDRLAIATSPEDDEQVEVLVWDIAPVLWIKAATQYIMYSSSRNENVPISK